jgi:alcohol dehydrogenase class IV
VLRIPDRTPEAVVDAVVEVLASFAVPSRLRDVAVTREAVIESADHAMDDWAITAGPHTPNRHEVIDLLTNAW